VEAAGGCLDLSDLVCLTSEWVRPVSALYRGKRVWECPPNGQGLVVLLALNILEGYDLASLPPLSAARLHLEIEALRLAFADARWHISDPAFHPLPLDDLLSKEYAAHQRSRIDPARAHLDRQASLEFPKVNTVYLSVVDAQGNACSLINSIYFSFGSGIVPAGWGFCLHNRGNGFRLDPAHPNALLPGKRPYHTIIPALATREADGSLYTSFGVMGAYMQPQGQLQVLSGLVDDGLDPQAALDRPRFCLLEGEPGAAVALEEGIPVKEMAHLAEMGHRVTPVSDWARAYIFGRGQVITREPSTGVLWAGSDPRADGCASPL
jgi:gamma-glutamyltranspeptidase/glutathione hydrolase